MLLWFRAAGAGRQYAPAALIDRRFPAPQLHVRWRLKAQQICLVLIFVMAALYGFAMAVLGPIPTAPAALAFVFVGLVFFWCRFDAADRGVSLPRWNRVLIVALALVGVPIYFFRTKPWPGAVWATAKALSVLVALPFVTGLTYAIVRAIAT